jgi:hypothetical protein
MMYGPLCVNVLYRFHAPLCQCTVVSLDINRIINVYMLTDARSFIHRIV